MSMPSAQPAATRSQRTITVVSLLVVVGALLTLILWSRGWLRERVDYIALLPDNAGISRSSAVVINGLPVGRVRETRLVERDGRLQVEVRFWVEARQTAWLRRGTRALVRSDLVSAARLELQPALGTAELLPPGTEIPAGIAPDVMTQLMELQPTIKQLLAEVGRMIAGINDRAAQFDPILAKIEKQIDGVDAHLAAVTAAVGDARNVLVQIKTDEAAVAGALGESLRRINAELLPELTQAVRANRTEVTESLRSLNRTLADVETQLPAILQLSRQTLKNSADFTEAAAHTWPFSRYVEKKAAAAAPRK